MSGSVITNQTNINKDNYFFILANGQQINVSTIVANSGVFSTIITDNTKTQYLSSAVAFISSITNNTIQTNYLSSAKAFISSLTTNNISTSNIDLTTINGSPISNFDLANWSQYPFNNDVIGILSNIGIFSPVYKPVYSLSNALNVVAGNIYAKYYPNDPLGVSYAGGNIYADGITNSPLFSGNTGQITDVQATTIEAGNPTTNPYGTISAYGVGNLAGFNALYVQGGVVLDGGGTIHGITIGTQPVLGVNTMRIDVLPVGINIASATFITMNAGGAGNLVAGGALALAGGDYISYNSDEHRFINTSAGNQATTIYVGNLSIMPNVGGSYPLRIANPEGAGVSINDITYFGFQNPVAYIPVYDLSANYIKSTSNNISRIDYVSKTIDSNTIITTDGFANPINSLYAISSIYTIAPPPINYINLSNTTYVIDTFSNYFLYTCDSNTAYTQTFYNSLTSADTLGQDVRCLFGWPGSTGAFNEYANFVNNNDINLQLEPSFPNSFIDGYTTLPFGSNAVYSDASTSNYLLSNFITPSNTYVSSLYISAYSTIQGLSSITQSITFNNNDSNIYSNFQLGEYILDCSVLKVNNISSGSITGGNSSNPLVSSFSTLAVSSLQANTISSFAIKSFYIDTYAISTNYISAGNIVGAINNKELTSTIGGLGTLGYVSSSQLTSTIKGLGTLGYVSSSQLTSTINGLGTLGYVSSSQLTSTINGLGTFKYISSSQLNSTINGLGTLGYVSSSQLTSTIGGLGTLGYVSSSQLISTTSGLITTISNNKNISTFSTIIVSSLQANTISSFAGTFHQIDTTYLTSFDNYLININGIGGSNLLVNNTIDMGNQNIQNVNTIKSFKLDSFTISTNYLSTGSLSIQDINISNNSISNVSSIYFYDMTLNSNYAVYCSSLDGLALINFDSAIRPNIPIVVFPELTNQAIYGDIFYSSNNFNFNDSVNTLASITASGINFGNTSIKPSYLGSSNIDVSGNVNISGSLSFCNIVLSNLTLSNLVVNNISNTGGASVGFEVPIAVDSIGGNTSNVIDFTDSIRFNGVEFYSDIYNANSITARRVSTTFISTGTIYSRETYTKYLGNNNPFAIESIIVNNNFDLGNNQISNCKGITTSALSTLIVSTGTIYSRETYTKYLGNNNPLAIESIIVNNNLDLGNNEISNSKGLTAGFLSTNSISTTAINSSNISTAKLSVYQIENVSSIICGSLSTNILSVYQIENLSSLVANSVQASRLSSQTINASTGIFTTFLSAPTLTTTTLNVYQLSNAYDTRIRFLQSVIAQNANLTMGTSSSPWTATYNQSNYGVLANFSTLQISSITTLGTSSNISIIGNVSAPQLIVSSINSKVYPFWSTLNIPNSTFSIKGNAVSNSDNPYVLYSNVQFPPYSKGFYEISQKAVLTKKSGGASADVHGNIFYTQGSFPSTPAFLLDGYSALPYVNQDNCSSFTTLKTMVNISSITTRNIIYYDSTGNNYVADLYMGNLVVQYTPPYGYGADLGQTIGF